MPKKKTTIEDLARIMKRGLDGVSLKMARKADMDKQFEGVDRQFEGVARQFDGVTRQFEGVNTRLDHMSARLGVVEYDIAEIRKHFVYRDEFDDALARISLVEKKLGIKSGK